jgi:hypothetical protein
MDEAAYNGIIIKVISYQSFFCQRYVDSQRLGSSPVSLPCVTGFEGYDDILEDTRCPRCGCKGMDAEGYFDYECLNCGYRGSVSED